MVGLPIVLILCVFLASLAMALGMKGLDRGKSMKRKQKLIQSFDRLVETGTQVSYGGPGEEQRVRLEMPGGRIAVKDSLIQLKRENETLRSEYLPLPLSSRDRDSFVLRSGSFSVGLTYSGESSDSGSNSLLLEIEEAKK